MIELTNELYEANKRTIYKACRQNFDPNSGIEFNDVLSYAHTIFCNAAKSYDENSGAKFNSWLTTQLKRLSGLKKRQIHHTDIKGVSEIAISLDANYEDSKDTVGDNGAYHASADYSAKMNELAAGDTWEDRIPDFQHYFDKMSDDAKQIFNDILDGYLYTEGECKTRKAFVKMSSDISPLKMFKRRYAKLGWNISRVTKARQELVDMIKLWKGDKLPCKLTRSVEKFIPEVLF